MVKVNNNPQRHPYGENDMTTTITGTAARRLNTVDETLSRVLADAIVFYQRLRFFHWTVQGSMFFVLHEKFEEMYNAWEGHIDEIAERLTSRGSTPPASLKEVLDISTLDENNSIPSANEMVQIIHNDLNHMGELIRSLIQLAEKENDRTTVNLMDNLNDESAKQLWMLGSFLNNN
ncbi:MAG TPA: DNA starvation/stationary phase protection protein [Phycisphaeraceae bacterium]|nr:DNA starvation/stationary phase protection protein [Phycisphaeraceae bacterium]